MENPNEKTNPEREFEICIGYRLSRIAKVKTDIYNDTVDDDGLDITDASMNDWREEYESTFMTPAELMEAFKEFIPALTGHYQDEWRKRCTGDKAGAIEAYRKLCRILDLEQSLDGWEETFEEAYEV